jgi:hypothetical protein
LRGIDRDCEAAAAVAVPVMVIVMKALGLAVEYAMLKVFGPVAEAYV